MTIVRPEVGLKRLSTLPNIFLPVHKFVKAYQSVQALLFDQSVVTSSLVGIDQSGFFLNRRHYLLVTKWSRFNHRHVIHRQSLHRQSLTGSCQANDSLFISTITIATAASAATTITIIYIYDNVIQTNRKRKCND